MTKKMTLERLATMIAEEFGGIHKRIDNIELAMATKEDLQTLRAEVMREMVSKGELQRTKEEIIQAIDHEILVIEKDMDSRLKDHDRRIASVERRVGTK